MNVKPYRNGVLIGKFMPAHRGHRHMIRFACEMCTSVTVVVDCVPGEWPSAQQRAERMKVDLAGLNVRVVGLTEITPQEPGDHPDFWKMWRDIMRGACQEPPDALICAQEYGLPLAQAIECELVPIDFDRDAITISATEIRADAWKNWDYILPNARLDYLTRICLEGPESTGKSTIGKQLAKDQGFSWAPEWAKVWIEQKLRAGESFEESSLLTIARGQIAQEKSLELDSKPVLLSDSSLLSTITWSEFLYGRVDPEIIKLFEDEEKRSPRERWLFTPETPWIDDVHRNVAANTTSESRRWDFWHLLVSNAKKFGVPFTVVPGGFSDKEQKIRELSNLIKPAQFIWKPPSGLSYDQYSGIDHHLPKP